VGLVHLFDYDLFHDTLGSSDCIDSNARVTSEYSVEGDLVGSDLI
jgi:hypothetical protein